MTIKTLQWCGLGIALAALGNGAMAQNRPPVADAGADRFMYIGSAILLHGGGSDPDGDILTDVLWTVNGSPATANYNLETPSYPFSAFSAYTPGWYELAFKTFDGQLWSEPDTMAIQAVRNQPPVAKATASATSGVTPFSVSFDGSGSVDPEGRPLSYYWSFGDGSDGSYERAPTHVFSMPGTFGVTMEVVDEVGTTDFALLRIEVARANVAPVLSPLAQMITGQGPLGVQFSANASDLDNDPLTYLWDFGDPMSADNSSRLANPFHQYTNPGSYLATLTVDDGRANTQAELTVYAGSVPEPASWGLAAIALGGLALSRRGRGALRRMQCRCAG